MMKLYAFQNKRTKKLVTGTDFGYFPAKQMFSDYNSPIFLTEVKLKSIYGLSSEIKHRDIDLDKFNLVECELSVIKPVRKNEIEKMLKGEWKND